MYGSADLDVFAALQNPWPPLDSTRVTYNLALTSARELWGEELKNNPSFGGHTLIRAGIDGPDPMVLCNGTRATCPTDPRQVAQGATHTCTGILATYTGDLFWLACTVVQGTAEQTGLADTARGASPEDVVVGQDPDAAQDYDADPAVRPPTSVVPAVFDSAAADARNHDVLKALGDGDETHFFQGGGAVLIGDGHSHEALAYLAEHGYGEGTVRITKGGVFSSGKLTVKDSPDQAAFEGAVARISDKDVEFE
jgi:hypothetical protein